MFVVSQYVILFFTVARMRGVVYNTFFSSRIFYDKNLLLVLRLAINAKTITKTPYSKA